MFINPKRKQNAEITYSYKFKNSIFALIGIILVIIVMTFFSILIRNDIKENDKLAIVIAIVIFSLSIIYGLQYSIFGLILCNKMKKDIKLNDYKTITLKPYDVKFNLYRPMRSNNYYIDNIKFIYYINSKKIVLWIDDVFIFKKPINKSKLINELMSKTETISYLSRSKYILTPVYGVKIKKYLSKYK